MSSTPLPQSAQLVRCSLVCMLVFLPLSACDIRQPAAQACWVSDSPAKSRAVVAQLEKVGVTAKVSQEKEVCVPSDQAALLTAAREAIEPLRCAA